jgi:hypothetical protein
LHASSPDNPKRKSAITNKRYGMIYITFKERFSI